MRQPPPYSVTHKKDGLASRLSSFLLPWSPGPLRPVLPAQSAARCRRLEARTHKQPISQPKISTRLSSFDLVGGLASIEKSPEMRFWAAAPKGTKSCRTQGESVRPSVRTSVRPYVRPSVPPWPHPQGFVSFGAQNPNCMAQI